MIQHGIDHPTQSEAIEYVIQQAIANINTGIPGEVLSFDESKGMAEIQIKVSQLYEDNVSLKMPPLANVLVERNRGNGGNAYFIMPVKVGDKGWLKFSQRTIDNWTQDGSQQNMTSLRMFDLSDAVFFPGLWPTNDPITENNTDVVIRNEKSRHSLKAEGHDINTEAGAFFKINVDKISIGNNAGEILSLFNDLLSQLLVSFGVSPTGPAPLDPASKLEITRIQNILGQIKE